MDKPIGYWLKHLDRLIEGAFDRALATRKVSRRHWQLLNVLESGPQDASGLAASLRPFWAEGTLTVDQVVDDLESRGWINRDGMGVFALTPRGRAERTRLAEEVHAIRRRVIHGVSEEEYQTTVRVLRHMTRNLEQPAR